MYLFFDTETTGLPRSWKAPVTDLNNWPRLVQLAYFLYDGEGNQISGGDFIIKPEGFTIPADVSRIHGITHERALIEGQPLNTVLQHFNLLIEQANWLVAHNMSFDEKIVGCEFLRNGMNNSIPAKNRICTMERTTNYCASRVHMVINGLSFLNYITNFSNHILRKHIMQPLILPQLPGAFGNLKSWGRFKTIISEI